MFLLTIPISNSEAFAIAHTSFINVCLRFYFRVTDRGGIYCFKLRYSPVPFFRMRRASSTSRIRYMMMLEFQSYSIHPSVVVAFEQGGLCYFYLFNVVLIHRTVTPIPSYLTLCSIISNCYPWFTIDDNICSTAQSNRSIISMCYQFIERGGIYYCFCSFLILIQTIHPMMILVLSF